MHPCIHASPGDGHAWPWTWFHALLMQDPLDIQVTGQRCEAIEPFGVLCHAYCLHPLDGAVAFIAYYSVLAWARWLTALWLGARVYVELEVLKA